jgi:hypothetical protein
VDEAAFGMLVLASGIKNGSELHLGVPRRLGVVAVAGRALLLSMLRPRACRVSPEINGNYFRFKYGQCDTFLLTCSSLLLPARRVPPPRCTRRNSRAFRPSPALPSLTLYAGIDKSRA